MPPITVVNIVAVSYSGSTWLNLMLGAHRDSLSVGEIDQAYKAGQASCRIHGPKCPLWSRFDPSADENPFIQIARISQKKFLIVNNTRRLLGQQNHPDIEAKFVWLIRDGRAVIASAMRKYPGRSAVRATRDWARAMRKKRKLICHQPPHHVMRVHWNELNADADRHMKIICAFLGMAYDPGMISYWNADTHFIGGNRGPMTILAQQQGIELHTPELRSPSRRRVPHVDLNFYKRADADNFVDERWRAELTDTQLRIFSLFGGRLNAKLGYGGGQDRSRLAP